MTQTQQENSQTNIRNNIEYSLNSFQVFLILYYHQRQGLRNSLKIDSDVCTPHQVTIK